MFDIVVPCLLQASSGSYIQLSLAGPRPRFVYARYSEATGVRLYKNQTFHFERLAATVVEHVSVGRREEPLTVRAIDFNVFRFNVLRLRLVLVRLHLARNGT